MYSQKLLHEIEVLSPELQKQVYDFVLFLRNKQRIVQKRTVGEYQDIIVIHEDFDAPLPEM